MDPVLFWGLVIFAGLSLLVMFVFAPMIIAVSRNHARAGTITTFTVITVVGSVLLGLASWVFPPIAGAVLVLNLIWLWMFVWAVMGNKEEVR